MALGIEVALSSGGWLVMESDAGPSCLVRRVVAKSILALRSRRHALDAYMGPRFHHGDIAPRVRSP